MRWSICVTEPTHHPGSIIEAAQPRPARVYRNHSELKYDLFLHAYWMEAQERTSFVFDRLHGNEILGGDIAVFEEIFTRAKEDSLKWPSTMRVKPSDFLNPEQIEYCRSSPSGRDWVERINEANSADVQSEIETILDCCKIARRENMCLSLYAQG